MNVSAERHLSKAEGYLAKGEEFYRKAAEEILAAKEADFQLTNREIGERFGKSEKWVRELVAWVTSSGTSTTPYSGDGPSSRSSTGHQDLVSAKKILAEAPVEQVERIVSALPKERQQAVKAAFGDEYAKHRQEFDEKERHLSPLERKEREAAVGAMTDLSRKVAVPFQMLTIVNHLDAATDALKEAVEGGALSPDLVLSIEKALRAFVTEFQVARAMVGLDSDLEGVL